MDDNSSTSSKVDKVDPALHAINKTDALSTARMSPYQTRSRKGSTLTEENIALHNDSPSRRVTRRMSQGSDVIVSTPIPVSKRNRRSPSLRSEENALASAKPKFIGAQENVVLEEDEVPEEAKSQSPALVQNGTATLGKISDLESKPATDDLIKNGAAIPNKSSDLEGTTVTDADSTENEADLGKSSNLEITADDFTKTKAATLEKIVNLEVKTATDVAVDLTENEAALEKSSNLIITTDDFTKTKAATLEKIVNLEVKTATDVAIDSTENEAALEKSNHLEVTTDETKSATLDKISNLEVKTATDVAVDSTENETATLEKSNRLEVTTDNLTKTKSATFEKINHLEVKKATDVAVDLTENEATTLEKSNSFEVMTDDLTKNKAATFEIINNLEVKKATDAVVLSTENEAATLEKSNNLEVKTATDNLNEKELKIAPVVSSADIDDVLNVTDQLSNTIHSSNNLTPLKTSDDIKPDSVKVDNPTSRFEQSDTNAPEAEELIIANPSLAELTTTAEGKDDVASSVQSTPVENELEKSRKLKWRESAGGCIHLSSDSENAERTSDVANIKISTDTTPTKSVDPSLSKIEKSQTSLDELSSIDDADTKLSLVTPSAVEQNVDVVNVLADQLVCVPNDDEAKLETLPTAVPIENQNGTNITADVEYPKSWGNSVHRKSDGKPIDGFGIQPIVTDIASSTTPAKPSTRNDESHVSVTSKESDEEHDEEDDEEDGDEDRSVNMFLDDEAEECNEEDSINEDDEENQIPEDHISLGSRTTTEESDDDSDMSSFIVSDSPVDLLDGTGDDLDIPNDTPKRNIKNDEKLDKSKQRKRHSKIDDTTSEEDVAKELDNLDDKPALKNSKRRSDTMPESKKSIKRMSLHPSVKLNPLNASKQSISKNMDNENDAGDELEVSNEEVPSRRQSKSYIRIDSSEEDVSKELENLDNEPSKRNSKRLSDTMPRSKKSINRMSLHPSVKLSTSTPPKESNSEKIDNENVAGDELEVANEEIPSRRQSKSYNKIVSSEEDVLKELENLDDKPSKRNSKRLSDLMPQSKKSINRMSLHPSLKLNTSKASKESNDENVDREIVPDTMDNKNDNSSEEDISKELENLTKKTKFKRSLSLSRSEKDKRVRLHSTGDAETVIDHKDSNSNKNVTEKCDEVLARCKDYISAINEEKRLEKEEHKVIKTEKSQKSKEKKERKLQDKKEKEAREAKRLVLVSQQMLHKKEKKMKKKRNDNEVDEKSKAIAKALAFSNKLLFEKNKHSHESSEVEVSPDVSKKRLFVSISTDDDQVAEKPKIKKKKMLNILKASEQVSESVVSSMGIKPTQTQQIAAKPHGFQIYAKSVEAKKKKKTDKSNQINKVIDVKRKLLKPQWTTSGQFKVEDLSPKVEGVAATTKFKVTSLTSGSNIATSSFNSFREKSLYNSKIPRESAEQLLSRKGKEKKLKKN